MKRSSGYRAIPFTFNRKAVAASASIANKQNTIHALVEVDITNPRYIMNEYKEKTGESLSLTAYVVTCLAKAIAENPQLNSFRKGRKLILLDDVTISVLIERELQNEKVPEPVGISNAQTKSFLQVQNEIRMAQQNSEDKLGSLSGITWIRFIPGTLLRLFIRVAAGNIKMAKRYGKVAVTAVGMFIKEPVWFIPLGGATVLVTIGGINRKAVFIEGVPEEREHLCLTLSFDHNIVDGAPAARFTKLFTELIKSGEPILGLN